MPNERSVIVQILAGQGGS